MRGCERVVTWSAIMCIMVDHTWKYVEGPDTTKTSRKVLTSTRASLDLSKLDPDNPDHYEDNPGILRDTYVILGSLFTPCPSMQSFPLYKGFGAGQT